MTFGKNGAYFVAASLLVLGAAVSLMTADVVQAQSGSRSRQGGARTQGGQSSGTRSQAPAAQRPFEDRFWEWLQKVEYQNWGPMPGQSADYYPGESPHGAFLKVYANRLASGSSQNMPYGSIIVKENYGADRQTLMAVTVMYRAKGYDADNGDWYWAKYEPTGRAARMNGRPVAGRVATCAECHSGAGGNDFVFLNDQ